MPIYIYIYRHTSQESLVMRCQANPSPLSGATEGGPSWAPPHVSHQIINFEHFLKGFCRCLDQASICNLVLPDFAIFHS